MEVTRIKPDMAPCWPKGLASLDKESEEKNGGCELTVGS